MVISALMMAAALVASDPDGVVATAPATNVDLTAVNRPVAASAEGAAHQAAEPHNLTTDQQIDRWLESRDPEATPYSGQRGERPVDDRKMHSEFTAGIGTGGYTDFGMAVSLPIGESGRLSLSYRQTENGLYGYGYPGGGYVGGYPYFNDTGYAFPGRYDPNAAANYELRVARPGGPPTNRRPIYQNDATVD
jgi:hypothetical protein